MLTAEALAGGLIGGTSGIFGLTAYAVTRTTPLTPRNPTQPPSTPTSSPILHSLTPYDLFSALNKPLQPSTTVAITQQYLNSKYPHQLSTTSKSLLTAIFNG